VSPKDAWSVGDTWETDLMPAQKIGMKTAKIGKYEGSPTVCFATLEQFLDYLKGRGK
jgi:FMN phosphatase YigB (HAD superfamily)